MPAWLDDIAPAIKRNERLLIAAHGNSLRALVKHLDGIADDNHLRLGWFLYETRSGAR